MTLRNYFFFVIWLLLLAGCKQNKPSLAGEDLVSINDFIDFFEPLHLPIQFDETGLKKKENDSLLISYKIFTQYIPDTLLSKIYGKGAKPRIFAMGKAIDENKDAYLFVKTVSGEKRAAFVLCFDKKDKFIASMPVIYMDQLAHTTQMAAMDKNFSIIKSVQQKNANGSMREGKDVYILNAETKDFMLILTDPLDEKPAEIINPIDTLPRKNKLSADYIVNKKNLVSIRDGRKPDRLLFFIHFEKSNGTCNGELKGEAILKSSRIAEYHANGNLCALQFTFTASSVSIQETEACGSYRGLRCLFEGAYPRKKELKANAVKKK